MSSQPPLWKRIADAYRSKILLGSLPHDTVLPSTAKLCRKWDASIYTIAKAMGVLADEGLVVTEDRQRRVVNCPPEGRGVSPVPQPVRSGRPKYRQLADALREEITSGRLAPGDQLPSIRELVGTHDAASGTVQQALRVLQADGLIEMRQGSGAFVRSGGVSVDVVTADRPKYMVIADDFRQAITTGLLKPGDQLPGRVELCERYECAGATVRQGLSVLIFEGLLKSHQGAGVFVTGGEWARCWRCAGRQVERPEVVVERSPLGGYMLAIGEGLEINYCPWCGRRLVGPLA